LTELIELTELTELTEQAYNHRNRYKFPHFDRLWAEEDGQALDVP
jgi:hypothetical protein